jgi:hypothetical protein
LPILQNFHLVIMGMLLLTNNNCISFLFFCLFSFHLFLITFSRVDPFLNKPFMREDIWHSTEYFKNTTMKVTHLHFWDAAMST